MNDVVPVFIGGEVGANLFWPTQKIWMSF